MSQTSSLILSNQLTVRPTTSPRISSSLLRWRAVASSANVVLVAPSNSRSGKPIRIVYRECLTTPPITHFTTGLGLGRPSPELGLISLLFVLSAAAGALSLLALISIPTMNAFRRLSTSMTKLSKVVAEEVPGTLYSLKLSGIEINDLTQQLSTLRSYLDIKIERKAGRNNKRRPNGGKNNPITN